MDQDADQDSSFDSKSPRSKKHESRRGFDTVPSNGRLKQPFAPPLLKIPSVFLLVKQLISQR